MSTSSITTLTEEEKSAVSLIISSERHIGTFLTGQLLMWLVVRFTLHIVAPDVFDVVSRSLYIAFFVTQIPVYLFWMLVLYLKKHIGTS